MWRVTHVRRDPPCSPSFALGRACTPCAPPFASGRAVALRAEGKSNFDRLGLPCAPPVCPGRGQFCLESAQICAPFALQAVWEHLAPRLLKDAQMKQSILSWSGSSQRLFKQMKRIFRSLIVLMVAGILVSGAAMAQDQTQRITPLTTPVADIERRICQNKICF